MHVRGIIAGLGNPGAKYEGTRHNLGFAVVDALLASMDPFACSELKKDATLHLWRGPLLRGGEPWLLLKPMTFMNLSGEAVARTASFYRIAPGDIVVVHDELDLAPGKLQWKFGGGLAGHNGLKSIAERLGTRDFSRLRIGIGKTDASRTTGHVLGTFRPEERAQAQESVDNAVRALRIYDAEGREAAARFAKGCGPAPGADKTAPPASAGKPTD
ncbi:MAG: aminoacyl-tRNA hydrolase [Desulfovibrionaceae bacterium]|jgi:PTH1 family peptidyl-tRNA hydrolase|nr:aminoacyl-tRNA hydrolase [Desulfovibrionaceae bacterium]